LLLLVGAAAFIAVSTNGTHSARAGLSAKKSGDPDAGSQKDTASVEKGPAALTAAEEEFAQRAYPAEDIPIELTQTAQRAWSAVKTRAIGKGKNSPGQWSMIGPSSANMPGLIVFSGADYTTSGRIYGTRARSGLHADAVPRLGRRRRRRNLAYDERSDRLTDVDLLSRDAGATLNDLTRDATSDTTPNGMHPDSRAIAVLPSNPNVVFFGSDGGLVRTSGSFADISAQCASRGLSAANLAICQQLLSSVPTQIYSLNRGLSTLQFQSLSANPTDSKSLMGGTQDNGTWTTTGSSVVWNLDIWGDGGQSGFNAANPDYRFNTFTGQANDANVRGGDPAKWVVITGDIVSSPEGSYFYGPVTADPNPANAGTIYQGVEQRLADTGLGRRPGIPRGQLLRVHHLVREHRVS
jgi:hypothetical protein